MNLLLLGLNHRTAPVALREQLAFSRQGVANALMLFREQFPDCEAAIISTCNRVEMLVGCKSGPVSTADVISFLAQARDLPVGAFKNHLYQADGKGVIKHLFRVISGLDSMAVGEYQIVNQLKQAYQLAHEQQTAGPLLHRLFHHAFGVSKRVRTDTTIGDAKTSIPSLAVDVIREAMPDFLRKKVLLVGAGEMAQLAAKYLQSAGMKHFTVTTRTLANARTLAEACGGEAVPLEQLSSELLNADVVITATSSPTAILKLDRVQATQNERAHRPLLLVDLSVPRNIEPEVAALRGVRLYDVDALGQMVAANLRQRAGQMEACEKIVEEEVAAFDKWIAESRVRPLIEQMVADVRALAEIEVRRFLKRCPDLSDKQREEVTQLADRIVGKLMHPCVCTVREQSRELSAAALAEAFHSQRLSFDSQESRVRQRQSA